MQDFIYNTGTDGGEFFNNQFLSNTLRSIDEGLVQDLRSLINQLVVSVDDQLFLLADNTLSLDDQNRYLALMHLFHMHKQSLVEKGIQRIRDEFHKFYQAQFNPGENGIFPEQLNFNWSGDSKKQFELEKLTEALWHKLHKENLERLKSLNSKLNGLFSCQCQDVDFPLSALYISHTIADMFIKVCVGAGDAMLVMSALMHSIAEFNHFYSQQHKRMALFDHETISTFSQPNTQQNTQPIFHSTSPISGANSTVKITSYRRDSSVDQINQDRLVNNRPVRDQFDFRDAATLSPEMDSCLSELQSVYNLPGSKLKGQALYDIIADRIRRQLTSQEAKAIKVVDNLFTRIMAEKSLPHAVRDQIESLKIPCVKLALDQSRLFSAKTHPISALIDLIADSSLLMALRRGEPVEDDPMFLAIKDAVQRLCFGYTDDDALISDINATLQYKIAQHIVKNKETYEKQRDKKLSLVDALKRKMHSQNVPPFIARFVRDVWYRVLNMNSDSGNEEYERLQHLLDDLIWSVQPKHLEQEKKMLLKMIPQLLEKIRSALSETYISEDKCERFIAELEHMHIYSLQGRQQWQGIGETDDYEHRYQATQLEKIEAGSWIRFIQNQRAYYLRMDYYNEFSREYSFVDTTYRKIVVLNKEELAKCLSLGELELHADHSLFNRSLRAIA